MVCNKTDCFYCDSGAECSSCRQCTNNINSIDKYLPQSSLFKSDNEGCLGFQCTARTFFESENSEKS